MVSIIEVTDKAQLRRFVDYPNELYKDVPQFVPATYGDDLSDWDRSKNPAFEYCDARCWLAMRGGEIVGRIGAIHSRKANDKWGANRLRFTQVDFIDDPEVSSALFRTVEAWAKELDCTAVHVPSASPTWTARVCWWRALTAAAAFSHTTTIPTTSTTWPPWAM